MAETSGYVRFASLVAWTFQLVNQQPLKMAFDHATTPFLSGLT